MVSFKEFYEMTIVKKTRALRVKSLNIFFKMGSVSAGRVTNTKKKLQQKPPNSNLYFPKFYLWCLSQTPLLVLLCEQYGLFLETQKTEQTT